MIRSVKEVKTRCSQILGDTDIVSIVKESSSPTAAYEMVFAETRDVSKAKAGRWLAILRRDFFEEYQKLISVTLIHANNGTVQTEKETDYEDGLCK